MRQFLVSTAAVLALAACAKKDEAAKAPDAGSAAAPAAASGPALSMKPPERKAGLWEQTMSTGEMKQTTRMCVSDEVNKKMTVWGQGASKDMCSQQSMTPTPGGWKFSSTCNMGPSGTIVSEGEAKGDFGSHYTVSIKSTTTGAQAAQMNGSHEMTMEGVWKGPCPADFKAGDMEVNGMKINMLTMADGMPAGVKPGERPTPAQMAALRKQMEATIKAQHDGR